MEQAIPKRRRWVRLVILAFLLTLIASALWLFLPGTSVTQANFDQIEVGMPVVEVQKLLGRGPNFISQMKGCVDSPTQFHTNNDPEAQRRDNHRDYYFNQWMSPEITIIVIADEKGEVVCRYSAEGQVQPWYMQFFDSIKRGLRL